MGHRLKQPHLDAPQLRLFGWVSAVVVSTATLLGCGAEPSSTTDASAVTPVAGVIAASAEESDARLGTVAPDFELPGSDGAMHRLADYRGQHVVLAFFPKAFTGG